VALVKNDQYILVLPVKNKNSQVTMKSLLSNMAGHAKRIVISVIGFTNSGVLLSGFV
jgi:Na+/H+ antiporter NhaA